MITLKEFVLNKFSNASLRQIAEKLEVSPTYLSLVLSKKVIASPKFIDKMFNIINNNKPLDFKQLADKGEEIRLFFSLIGFEAFLRYCVFLIKSKHKKLSKNKKQEFLEACISELFFGFIEK